MPMATTGPGGLLLPRRIGRRPQLDESPSCDFENRRQPGEQPPRPPGQRLFVDAHETDSGAPVQSDVPGLSTAFRPPCNRAWPIRTMVCTGSRITTDGQSRAGLPTAEPIGLGRARPGVPPIHPHRFRRRRRARQSLRGGARMINPDVKADPANWTTVRNWKFEREGPAEARRRQIHTVKFLAARGN